MVELPAPLPAPAVWLILGLLLGIIISLITGEGLVEEIPLGSAGGFIGGTLYTLVGDRPSGLKSLVVHALIGALVLIIVFDVLKAL